MKKLFRITTAVIGKIAMLILLSGLTIFNIVLKAFTYVFRFLAIPVIFFGLIIVGATWLDNGFSPSLLSALGVFAVLGTMYFVLPFVPELVFYAQLRMKDYLLAPIIVRSRMKFTL